MNSQKKDGQLQPGRQMSERFRLGMLLAVVGGFLDAYTYMIRGHVFANAQTGNMVLMGVGAAQGHWRNVFYYLVPIFAFAAGVWVAESIKKKYKEGRLLHWRQVVVFIEFVILLLVAMMPADDWNTPANVLISFICAMQVESFRKVNGNAFATTMCTGNLRSGTELLFHYKRTGDTEQLRKSIQYYGIILFFIMGAVIGTICTKWMAEKAVLISCGILAVIFVMMFANQKE